MDYTQHLRVEMLLRDLSHLERGVREQALKELVAIGPTAIDGLSQYIKDPYNRGRNLAVRALGLIQDTAAVSAVSDALRDSDEVVRSVAAWALGQLGDTRAIPSLLDAVKDSKQLVRTRAAAALATLGYSHNLALPSVDETLIRQHVQNLRSQPAFVREQAAQALVAIGSAAVDALLGALTEVEPWARKAAVDILAVIGDPQVVDALTDVAEHDVEPSVRQAARLALTKLNA